MKETVYILGTRHRFQGTYTLSNRATKTQLKEFKVYLRGLIDRHEVCAIAEEMSIEALKKYPHPDLPSGESVPFQVAKELGLAHKYCCPPDRATRDRLGLSPDGRLGTPKDNEKRETYWLEQLEKLDSFPCLFVLGIIHVTSFSNLLEKSGYKSEIVNAEWKPNR